MIQSSGISHNSYFLASAGRAAVIDPRRDCEVYIDLAREHGVIITHIFETHRNEDYIIGSLELADRCGADIYHGSQMDFKYGEPVMEGDTFRIGTLKLTILETPGHTLESISVLVSDTEVADTPYLLFSGDVIFSGEVGRTDFFGQQKRAWASELLYNSISTKLLPLGDGTIVLPAHGAGSVCGSEISDHEMTTIGYEKATNPLLKLNKKEFIELKVNEHHYMPPYFRKMEDLNRSGAPLLRHLPDLRPLTVSEVEEYSHDAVQILDIRSPTSFAAGHIPGSYSVWREGIPSFIGWILNYQDPIILVDDFNLDLTTVSRHFVRLGYDNLYGVLSGGFPAWFKGAAPVAQIGAWSVQDLAERSGKEQFFLLDVRDISNWKRSGHIPGAHHIWVGELSSRITEVPRDGAVVVYCDAGYKGSLAASILRRAGYEKITNVLGGMSAYQKAGYPVSR